MNINRRLFATLIIITLLLIFFRFNQIPKNVSFDEIDFARVAISLNHVSYTPYLPQATGHVTLYFYIILLSFKIFGISNFALRLPAALFGFGNVIIFYFLWRRILKNDRSRDRWAFIFSLVFISLHWYLNFARFAFEATFLLFLELSAIYWLLYFLEKKSLAPLLLTAIFTALAFHSYYPGRAFFLLPIFVVGGFSRKSLLLFLTIFIIFISPLLFYFTNHPDLRIDQQLYFKNSQLTLNNKLDLLLQNAKKITAMFHLQGDLNGRHNYPGKPALNLGLGIIFVVGLALAVVHFNESYNRIFLIYFFLSLLPSFLTYPWENPNMLRTFTAIPSIIYFLSLVIFSLLKYVSKSKRTYLSYLLIIFLIGSALYELRTYFYYQTPTFKNAFEETKDIGLFLKP
ncbi:glycosyltransferase family 39 protein [Candidatus Roizmanbacteria bacterium]|nr:glycosyltransferase family 39 protein [Candidatus Roizmanbacteria bacterium]